MSTAFFSQSTKNYEAQKAYWETENCLSNPKFIGLFVASRYLCQYILFSEPPAKKLQGKSKSLQFFSEN